MSWKLKNTPIAWLYKDTDQFLQLGDTPVTYSGQGGKTISVNSGETALEFVNNEATDEKIKVSLNDTTAGYLNSKLAVGAGLTATEAPDAGDEVFTLTVGSDQIKDTMIDWGTGANQVSAVDVPIADSDSYYTGTEVETALSEVGDKFDAMNEPTGFPNRTDSTITWSDGTPDYTLSIAPVGASFSFYQDGLKYTKSSTETHQISGAEGTHYIYYDAGSLTSTANPTFAQEFTIVTVKVLVAIVYWDATNSEGIYVGEERHGITMDGDTHANLHFSVGLRWYTGIALNTIDADQDGSSNAHAQFGVDTGSIADEDIGLTPDAVVSTTGLPVYWRSGADGDWRRDTNAGYSFLISGTRPNWNELTGGAWQQTETGDKDFMLVHVFATTEKDNPMIAIMGQAVYEKKKQAREGATTEVGNLLLGNLPGPEITPIASVIFECKDGYTNAVNARIVTTDEGDDYVDWRESDITRTAAGGDHGSLGGLSDDDHTQYARISQVTDPQTIGLTGSRLTKLWADDITVTNAIAGDITGNAATVTDGVYTTDFPLNQDTTGKAATAGNADTVTNATLTTALTVDTGAVTLTGDVAGSVLTLGDGAISIDGSNTGDQVIPDNEAGAADNFLTAYDNTTGAWTKAQPTWANIDKTTSDIADITTKSHTSLSDIGTNAHAAIDTFIGTTVPTVYAPLNSPTLVTPTIGVATATSIAIGANTLDTNEWAFLDGQDQALKISDSPTFDDITTTDNVVVGDDLVFTSANAVQNFTGASWAKINTVNGILYLNYDYPTNSVNVGRSGNNLTHSIFGPTEVETTSTVGQQALTIDQNDADQAFTDHQGTIAASAASNISSWTAGNSIQGFIKMEVNGSAVWMPYYDAPSS